MSPNVMRKVPFVKIIISNKLLFFLNTRVHCWIKHMLQVTAPKFLDEYSGNVIAQTTLVGHYSKEKMAK